MKKYDNTMMKTAILWSKESYCKRRQVGAVLAKEGRILSIGYNGLPKGYKTNDCETISITKKEVCPYCSHSTFWNGTYTNYHCQRCDEKFDNPKIEEIEQKVTKDIVIHAESNALAFAGKYGISTKDCDLYVTLSPCIECSKIIIQHGIKRVVYLDEYKDTRGLDFLKENGVEVQKIEQIKDIL